jgi:hypothetical protein
VDCDNHGCSIESPYVEADRSIDVDEVFVTEFLVCSFDDSS